ncbi:CHAT domain-containing protein [Streptomyces sp. ISL-44]|uniref:CHAT domain-containing protein n=1 Tax=Streptomyces sp. ISL-44 TaxID=2819184 RepID=UPI001BECDC63|nr:CHAT domain-containing protein [Streptomyces sp. ISL-44]MBT2543131.1 CHAT domain-containing protein [Streptomyces sp. ISL-44]
MPEGLNREGPATNPLARRLKAYSARQDIGVLLEPEAEQDAAESLESTVRAVLQDMQLDVERHLRLLELAGWVFWLRSGADPQRNPGHERDLTLSLTLLAPLRDAEPESTPEAVRRVLPAPPRPGAPQVRGWGDLAGHLLQEAGPHDRTALLAAAAVLQLCMGMSEAEADRARSTSNLAHVLTLLHEHHAVPDTMTAALGFARRLFEESSSDTPEQAAYLAHLCEVLLVAYKSRHTPDALTELIGLNRKALKMLPGNHPNRPDHTTNLAGLLHIRYQETGDTGSLREAVALSRSLIAALPPGHPALPRELNNLAFHLERLAADQSGPIDTATLDEMISLGRTALAQPTGPGPALDLRIALTANLSRWLRLRARLSQPGEAAAHDADEALLLAREAHGSSSGHPTGVVLEALATALSDRYTRSGDRAALDEAVTLLRTAVDAAETPHRQAARRFILGSTLNNRYLDLGDPADAGEAARLLREVADSSAASLRHRLEGAWAAGKLALALGAPATAAEDLTLAVRLLPELVGEVWQDRDRARTLAEFAPLPAVAAACLISIGRPERALELLEQGRGLIHGESAVISADLERLRGRSPELAAALETFPGDWQAAPDADRRQQLAEQRQRLTAEIRQLPGFEEFLHPPRLAEILAACKAGPVVVTIAGKDGDGSHALIVTEDGVRSLPLPRLNRDTVGALNTSIIAGSELALDPDRSVRERLLAEHDVRSGLVLLWDAVAGPVLDAVRDLPRSGTDDPAGRPRLWWCPTGLLSYFPLHMAERPAEGAAFDLVTSSYTSTVRALGQARPWRTSAGSRPLVVAVPHAPGVPDLPGADEEASVLIGMLPGARLLRGQAATRERLMAGLQHHDIVHIASHAGFDADRHYEGHLVLHDGRLHFSNIAAARAGQGGLAFLSACGTARSRIDVPDESLNLLSAFQLAGFSDLVGSLWPVADHASVRLAESFYQHLTTYKSTGVAHALHHAVSQLRARHPDRPSLWASPVHIGP